VQNLRNIPALVRLSGRRVAAVEEKGRITVWRVVGAVALGYLAAGVAYVVLPIILAYPAGRLGFPWSAVEAVDTLASLGIWVFVSGYCINRWRQKRTI
jgi:hypothetical protein